jgi:pimeloyl-ACP methyl ester carboxylesterase
MGDDDAWQAKQPPLNVVNQPMEGVMHSWFFRFLYAGTVIVILSACAGAGAATQPKSGSNLVMEEFKVPSDSGIEIFVRNKHASTMTNFSADKTVVFIHGATSPSESCFDLSVGGFSWMDFIAEGGYDVYLMDVRGYGRSTRPPQMSLPAEESAPVATTEEAVRDLSAVVEFIKHRRSIDKVNVLAWSWGTFIAQWYAAKNLNNVNKLALYAPLWIRQMPSTAQVEPGPLGAYRSVTVAQVSVGWLTGVPEDKKADLIPEGWVDVHAAALLDSDPVGWLQTPRVFRAPNGVIFDAIRYGNGVPIPFDVRDIRVPVLLIKAEWDSVTPSYMAQTLFAKLVNSPLKRYIELGEGTHMVFLEKNRMMLFREVQLFLDEPMNAKK